MDKLKEFDAKQFVEKFLGRRYIAYEELALAAYTYGVEQALATPAARRGAAKRLHKVIASLAFFACSLSALGPSERQVSHKCDGRTSTDRGSRHPGAAGE